MTQFNTPTDSSPSETPAANAGTQSDISGASQQHSNSLGNNVDMSEGGQFTQLANQWWDKQGPFATLHEINPLRLNWIEENVIRYMGTGLTGKRS